MKLVVVALFVFVVSGLLATTSFLNAGAQTQVPSWHVHAEAIDASGTVLPGGRRTLCRTVKISASWVECVDGSGKYWAFPESRVWDVQGTQVP